MPRKQIYSVQPNQGINLAVLVTAFLVGAVGGVALKLLGAPILVTAAFPVVVLALYVGANFATRQTAIEPETVGDNSYYLGFLFTLASLATTLYQIRGIEAEAESAARLIPSMISGFGVALTSTICGVFIRIMLMQMRPDIVARDREARRDLAQGARDFRLAISEASRQLKSISIETAQHATERNARVSEIADKHMKQADALVQRQNKQFDETFNNFSQRLSDDLATALSSGITAALKKLGTSADEIAVSLQDMSAAHAESIGLVRTANKDVAQAAVDFKAAMSEHHRVALGSYRSLEGRAEKISAALAAAIDDLNQGAAGLQRSLAKQADSLDQRTEKIIAGFAELQSSVGQVTDGLKAAASQLKTSIERLDERAAALDASRDASKQWAGEPADSQSQDQDNRTSISALGRRLRGWR